MVTSLVSKYAGLTRFFRGAHRNRGCVQVFIEIVSVGVYERLHVTRFYKKKKLCYARPCTKHTNGWSFPFCLFLGCPVLAQIVDRAKNHATSGPKIAGSLSVLHY